MIKELDFSENRAPEQIDEALEFYAELTLQEDEYEHVTGVRYDDVEDDPAVLTKEQEELLLLYNWN